MPFSKFSHLDNNNSQEMQLIPQNSTTVVLVGPLAHKLQDLETSFALSSPQTPYLFIDGGAHFKEQRAGKIVGDGDSYPHAKDIEQLLPTAKDFSDLAFAFKMLQTYPLQQIFLFGFLGGRQDHHLCNLGEAAHFLSSLSAARLYFDDSLLMLAAGHHQLQHLTGTFSLLAIAPTMLRLTGHCQYPLPQWTPLSPLRSTGLSNVGAGKGEVLIETQGPLLLIPEATPTWQLQCRSRTLTAT